MGTPVDTAKARGTFDFFGLIVGRVPRAVTCVRQRRAAAQAGLMSLCHTPRPRGDDPTETMAAALQTHLLAGELPLLRSPAIAHGGSEC